MKSAITAGGAPQAIGPYSQAIQAGGWVFVSGQLPLDPAGGNMPAGVAEQTESCLRNVAAILGQAGLKMSDVVKTTVFLTDRTLLAPYRAARAAAFAGHAPASTLLFVAGLADPKFVVEVEAEAVA